MTLLVEDNPVDVHMIRYALQEQHWQGEVIVAEDGEKAFHYLLQYDPYGEAAPPDLVILDLNLPKRSGTEILSLVRGRDDLRHIPVVVLSSSPEDVIRDKIEGNKLHAELLLTKPSNVDEYLAIGRSVRECFEQFQKTNGQALPDII